MLQRREGAWNKADAHTDSDPNESTIGRGEGDEEPVGTPRIRRKKRVCLGA